MHCVPQVPEHCSVVVKTKFSCANKKQAKIERDQSDNKIAY